MNWWETLIRRFRFNWRYLGNPPWNTGVSPPELQRFLATASPGRALDVGCGTGTNLLTMVEVGWAVTGIDLVWLPVWQARHKLRQAGHTARILRANVGRPLRLEASFDLVLDIGCYHSLIPQSRIHYRENLRRWLDSGGVFLIYAHRRVCPDSSHGVTSKDFDAFNEFLTLTWRKDDDERRPDGGGGRPSTWAQFVRGAV